MIREAVLTDVLDLLKIAEDFINESEWGWKFSRERSINKFVSYIKHYEATVLVSCTEEITGVAMLAFDEEFHDENIGYISKFYIAKKARGNGAARVIAGFK